MSIIRHTLTGTVILLTLGLGSTGHAQVPPAEGAPGLVPAPDAPAADDAVNSTVVYHADYFAPYNPVSANDMLSRIPGLSLGGGGGRGGGGNRGLGTSGNLLINGQRLAGKDNSTQNQLDRIAASEVQRIEIIRDTSGELNVRGAGQVINIVLAEALSRSSTQAELITRLNQDDTLEAGATVSHSRQVGGFTALINLEARPNYENRETWEASVTPDGTVIERLLENNIRDQNEYQTSASISYSTGAHRMQLNGLLQELSYPRPISRRFVDIDGDRIIPFAERELTDNDESNWEVGGDYEYTFDNGSRLSLLFVVNEEVRDSVRERFESGLGDPDGALEKNLFIESNRTTTEKIVQGNYNFSLTDSQSLRLGLERADTELNSSLFIATRSGTQPPSPRFGGLSPIPSLNNAGTTVQEIRYEGFAFHNWTLSDRANLESSLVYETSEISQRGAVQKTRDFSFLRPAVDYRYNITDNFQFRASVRREVSQLSFASFAATAQEDDRNRDANAGNPELVPEKAWNYTSELEYRLPQDAGVLSARLFYADIDDYIGRINATVDPNQPLSATGNVGPSQRTGLFLNASSRLTYFNRPDAIVSLGVGMFDSQVIDPFLGTQQRTGGRGFSRLNFRHDVTALGLNYGVEFQYPFNGGNADIDITTITRNYQDTSLNLFVSKVFFNNLTFRLESDNTLDSESCRERQRFNGTTIDGTVRVTEDSCSSRGRRLTLRIQTTF